MTSGIYMISSLTNNKKYIGSSNNIAKRSHQHFYDLRLNNHHSQYLQNHYNKYGKEDLDLNIIEVVEDLDLLIEREQFYIDTLKPEFNILQIAGSPLGFKRKGCKYYIYLKLLNMYRTFYAVNGENLIFSYPYNEVDAIAQIEYIKTLTLTQLLNYYNECKDKPKTRYRNAKYYGFNKRSNKWRVKFKINGQSKEFGEYITEQEAIDRVKEVKLIFQIV